MMSKALEIGMYGSLMYWTRLSLYNEWVDEVTGAGEFLRGRTFARRLH